MGGVRDPDRPGGQEGGDQGPAGQARPPRDRVAQGEGRRDPDRVKPFPWLTAEAKRSTFFTEKRLNFHVKCGMVKGVIGKRGDVLKDAAR